MLFIMFVQVMGEYKNLAQDHELSKVSIRLFKKSLQYRNYNVEI